MIAVFLFVTVSLALGNPTIEYPHPDRTIDDKRFSDIFPNDAYYSLNDNITLTSSFGTTTYRGFEEIYRFDENDQNWGIFVEGDFMYVSNANDGVNIHDITDIRNPIHVSNIPTGMARAFEVRGDFLYLCDDSGAGLRVYDISDKSNPVHMNSIASFSANDVAINWPYAYVSDWSAGLTIYKFESPGSFSKVNNFLDGGGPVNPTVTDGTYLYLSKGSKLDIYNLTNATNPGHMSSISGFGYPFDFKVVGDLLYIAYNNLKIYNISDRFNPDLLVDWNNGGSLEAKEVEVVGNKAYIANGQNAESVVIVDVSDPSDPSRIVGLSLSGSNGIDRIHFANGFIFYHDDGAMGAGTEGRGILMNGGIEVNGNVSDDACVTQVDITVSDLFSSESTVDSFDIIFLNCSVTPAVGYFEHVKGDYLGYNTPSVYGCDTPTAQISGRSRAQGFYFRNHLLYIFGGEMLNTHAMNQTGYLNDVWSFDTFKHFFCFITGNETLSIQNSSYGDLVEFSVSNYPSSRSSYAAAQSYFSFFIFGGLGLKNGEKHLMNDMWEFLVVRAPVEHHYQWRILMEEEEVQEQQQQEQQPSARFGACMAQFSEGGNTVYLFGGEVSSLVNESSGLLAMKNDLWEYSISTNEFHLLRNGSIENDVFVNNEFFSVEEYYTIGDDQVGIFDPPRRSFCSCWVDKNSNLFIFGGKFPNFFSSNDVWIYNTSSTSRSWMFISGGKNNTESVFEESTSPYSFDQNNLPSHRYGMIGFSNQLSFFEENIFVFFGGGRYSQASWEVWGEAWVFSNELKQWKFANGTLGVANIESTDSMIGARSFGLGIALPDQSLYIFGGESIRPCC